MKEFLRTAGAEKKLIIVSLILALLPAAVLAILIEQNWVNVPHWDQWIYAQLFEKLVDGTLSFEDLFLQHNDSRTLFPRMFFLGLGKITNWDVRWEMSAMFMLACLTSLNVFLIGKATIGGSLPKRFLLLLLTNLLIFNPIQWQNWLWGLQLVVFIPMFCITCSLVIVQSRWNDLTKLVSCAALSTISTYSFANGMLAWIVLFPVIIIPEFWKLHEHRNRRVAAWIFFFILNIGFYFHDFTKPSDTPAFFHTLSQPETTILYFLGYLGSPLSFGIFADPLVVASTAGACLLIIFSGFGCMAMRQLKNRELLVKSLPWLVVGFFVLGSALLCTAGRAGFGVYQSLVSKYTTISIWLPIALIHLTAVFPPKSTDQTVISSCIVKLLRAWPIGAACLIGLALLTGVYGAQQMTALRVQRLHAKGCLLFINFFPQKSLELELFPDIEVLAKNANILNRMGLLTPGLFKSPKLIAGPRAGAFKTGIPGRFESLRRVSITGYRAIGWAGKNKPADLVLLAFQKDNGTWTAFTTASHEGGTPVPGMDNDTSNTDTSFGWLSSFSRKGKPSGRIRISAWVLDADSGSTYQLKDRYTIEENGSVVEDKSE